MAPSDDVAKTGRRRERAVILLLVGCALLLPPGARLFLLEEKVAGIPLALIAVFAIWALLIAFAAYLSRGLSQRISEEDPAP